MTDSHCHLDFKQFDDQRDECVKEALHSGVHTIINIGTDISSSQRSIDLAEKYEAIYATVGVHPHDAKTLNDAAYDRLRTLAGQNKVCAIGEIGLDYYRDLSPRPIQKRALRRQLELAAEMQLPVVIHTRESFDDTFAIVSEYSERLPGGVFHCFPGDAVAASMVFDIGFIISVGGVITFKNSTMAKVAAEVPLEKIIIETDAPYLTPEPFRGKLNRPAYVVHVCRKLAELQGLKTEEVERITDRTCHKLFGIAETFAG